MNVSNSPIERIAIIVAMNDEAEPIIDKLKMKYKNPVKLGINPKLQLEVYQTKINQKKVFLIKNGKDPINDVDRVGTQPAVLTSYAAIESLKPDTIISAGTAGGLKDSQIGEVYVSNSPFVFCDRIISSPSYKAYGIGHFNYLPLILAAKDLNLKLGVVATGNSLVPSERDLLELKSLKADVVDMEAAAIAEVAQRLDVKMVAIKSVTNFLDKNLHTDYKNNYKIAVDNLAEKIASLIPHILGKKPSQLYLDPANGLAEGNLIQFSDDENDIKDFSTYCILNEENIPRYLKQLSNPNLKAFCEGKKLYPSLAQTSNLDRAKAPGVDDRKLVNISNIDRSTIVKPRELSHGTKSKFEPGWGITIESIGDGNLNNVFRVVNTDTKKSLIIKQALPYLKCIGERLSPFFRKNALRNKLYQTCR